MSSRGCCEKIIKIIAMMLKCYRCNRLREITWNFCPHCNARLQDNRIALQPDPVNDIQFLHNFYSYGWYSRHTTSIALYDAIISLSNYYNNERPDTHRAIIEQYRAEKILRANMFAEYMALIEAFGFLCIAIRNRNKKSILWSYMNTEPREVNQFFHSLRSKNNLSLASFLKLPSNKIMLSILKPFFDNDAPELNESLFVTHAHRILDISEIYCDNKQLNVRTYNKIKHGFPIIDDEEWLGSSGDSNKIAVIVEGLTNEFPKRVGLWRLSMNQDRADIDISNVYNITLLGAELMALCLKLHDYGYLYS
jgi:hypothetical protein